MLSRYEREVESIAVSFFFPLFLVRRESDLGRSLTARELEKGQKRRKEKFTLALVSPYLPNYLPRFFSRDALHFPPHSLFILPGDFPPGDQEGLTRAILPPSHRGHLPRPPQLGESRQRRPTQINEHINLVLTCAD